MASIITLIIASAATILLVGSDRVEGDDIEKIDYLIAIFVLFVPLLLYFVISPFIPDIFKAVASF